MRIRAIYAVLVHGSWCYLESTESFVPFCVSYTLSGTESINVRIGPVIEQLEPPTQTGPQYRVVAVQAEMQREVDQIPHDRADFEEFRRPCFDVLQRFLRHLRRATADASIDVRLVNVSARYYDDSGLELHLLRSAEMVAELLGDTFVLHHDEGAPWRTSMTSTLRGHDNPLTEELLLDAESFIWSRNYNMALINAAVACERLLYQSVEQALTRLGGITKSQAENIAQQVSNRELPAILGCFYDIPAGFPDDLSAVFNQRNNLLHKGQKKAVSREVARAAIATARSLMEIHPGPILSSAP